MRLQSLAVFICTALLGSGCATSRIAHLAKEHSVTDPKNHQSRVVPGNKAVWALAPVTVAWDVATTPILGLGLWLLWATGYDEC